MDVMGKATKSRKHKRPEILLNSLYSHLAKVETMAEELTKSMAADSERPDLVKLAETYKYTKWLRTVGEFNAWRWLERLEEAVVKALIKACEGATNDPAS